MNNNTFWEAEEELIATETNTKSLPASSPSIDWYLDQTLISHLWALREIRERCLDALDLRLTSIRDRINNAHVFDETPDPEQLEVDKRLYEKINLRYQFHVNEIDRIVAELKSYGVEHNGDRPGPKFS
jgi:cytosine/adenosine deaminase-related metal-dependent hydrolase